RPFPWSPAMAQLLVLHGPNLNLLGTREPEVYGRMTLAEIDAHLHRRAEAAGHRVECFQSNAEPALVDRVQAPERDGPACAGINPAALTPSTVAVRDALPAVAIPSSAVHLSNPPAREPFRHKTYFSDLAVGVVAGLAPDGYAHALDAAIARLATD